MSGKQVYHAAVVGAGVVGLAAAWQFRRLGPDRIVILERFHHGHDRASSHGKSRITRSAYGHPAYVHLMRAANHREWPRLEAAAGERLVHPNPACFFGRGDRFQVFLDTMRGFPDETEILSPATAGARFPALRLDGMEGAILDHTAGVIAASRTLAALNRLCLGEGIELREETRVVAVEPEADAVRVRTDRGDVLARHVLIAAGPWISALVPELAPRLTVIRQSVGYFKLGGAPEAMGLGRFPVWGYVGNEPTDFYYGLPEFEREGVKIARHFIAGRHDDPEAPEAPPASELEDLRRFAALHFAAPVETLVGAESCYYTCTASEDFVIDRHPEDARIAFASACSGHGFKFGPLTGRILAELAFLGKTGVPEFELHRETFALRGPGSPRDRDGFLSEPGG